MGRYDGIPPGDTTQYSVRGGNYGRKAVCFHCRCSIRLDQNTGDFHEHYDVDRNHVLRGRSRAQIVIDGVAQVCPGSDTKPIPLAYKFPDGEALPSMYGG